MGTALNDADEAIHPVGAQSNWNESRYVEFWDARQRIGGWFRIGNRSLGGKRIGPPRCNSCGARIRPGVVWFGEALPTRHGHLGMTSRKGPLR